MNKVNIFLSFTTLLTFWGNELGSCSKVDNRSTTLLDKETFLSLYSEINFSSYNVLTLNEKTTFKTGRVKTTYEYDINRKDESSYHYLSYKESFLNSDIISYELKNDAGSYIYYENNSASKIYEREEAKNFLDSLMSDYLLKQYNFTSHYNIYLLDSSSYSFYKYDEDNSFKIYDNNNKISYDINKYGLITNIYSESYEIDENNYTYVLSDYNIDITYSIEVNAE